MKKEIRATFNGGESMFHKQILKIIADAGISQSDFIKSSIITLIFYCSDPDTGKVTQQDILDHLKSMKRNQAILSFTGVKSGLNVPMVSFLNHQIKLSGGVKND